MKTKRWYKGNAGLVKGRAAQEASRTGNYNPKNKIVLCQGCGRDTTNANMLCDNCNRESEE